MLSLFDESCSGISLTAGGRQQRSNRLSLINVKDLNLLFFFFSRLKIRQHVSKNKITETSLNKNKFVIFLGFKNKRKVLQNIKNSCWSGKLKSKYMIMQTKAGSSCLVQTPQLSAHIRPTFSPKFKCEVRKTTALI